LSSVALFAELQGLFGADIFLSPEGRSLCCIQPDAELVLQRDTTRDEVREFAFHDERQCCGYFSYEFGLGLRGVKSRKPAGKFPYGVLRKYEVVVVVPSCHTADLENIEVLVHDSCPSDLASSIREVVSKHQNESFTTEEFVSRADYSKQFSGFEQSLSRAEYESGVTQVLEFIRGGHTYQLNYSIRYTLNEAELDMKQLFYSLYRKWPAQFYASFQISSFDILSTSPELFLRVQNGNVLSQPIKGTLSFDEYSPELEKLVTDSPKESAELSMIVDLMRNDISTCCEYGSVTVENHKSIFVVDKLLQMYSDVHGKLKADCDVVDLLWETLPGGSVTGCPKKRSLEIIDVLEPHRRDVYCGSFVVFDGPQDMESSIAIRTGYLDKKDKKFHFFTGSGIVVDSDPKKEYKETVAKAGKFFHIFGVN
jgi:para-aminobenzoate synthetase component 1